MYYNIGRVYTKYLGPQAVSLVYYTLSLSRKVHYWCFHCNALLWYVTESNTNWSSLLCFIILHHDLTNIHNIIMEMHNMFCAFLNSAQKLALIFGLCNMAGRPVSQCYIYMYKKINSQEYHNYTEHSLIVCKLDDILDESIRRELIHLGYILTKVFKRH